MTDESVSGVILDVLAEVGVRQVFGIPGDAINGLVEAIRKQEVIAFVQVRHEEAGAFAAGAQAKLTGGLGVCVGTAGPGAIHLLNGLYDAKMDHAPVLAITGQVATRYIGTDYHQEVDLYTLFKDVAVFNEVIMTPEQLPELVVHACQSALAHGSVAHLSVPLDLAGHKVSKPRARSPVFRLHAETTPCDADLERAAELLNGASAVAILAGIGCRDAREALIATAERLGAPIVRSLRAKEVLPDDHRLSVGGLGMLGGKPAVEAIEGCDALLMVGTDFPYHDFYPERIPAVQIDVDPTRLGKRYAVEVGLVGHARPTLEALAPKLARKDGRSFLERCQASMKNWLDEAAEIETSDATPIRPQRVARAVADLARDDAIFICDTGAVTVWAARHLRLRKRQRFTLSSSLASMAFALPGAIGAQLAYPDRQVVALAGDGGFSMLMADFLTAVKYRLPITVVVFNNARLGLIQFEQEVQGFPDFQTELHNPDFAAFAELCGGRGISVSDPGSLESALETALGAAEPYVVDVAVNPNEVPMPPKVLLSQAMGYGMAKVKEFFSA